MITTYRTNKPIIRFQTILLAQPANRGRERPATLTVSYARDSNSRLTRCSLGFRPLQGRTSSNGVQSFALSPSSTKMKSSYESKMTENCASAFSIRLNTLLFAGPHAWLISFIRRIFDSSVVRLNCSDIMLCRDNSQGSRKTSSMNGFAVALNQIKEGSDDARKTH